MPAMTPKAPPYFVGAATALVTALEAKSDETGKHCHSVARVATRLGKAAGLSDDEMFQLRYGALLHDVGKLAIPDSILKKPGRLTEDEWAAMRHHPSIGYEMLLSLGFPPRIATVVKEHHERFDGTGYSFGLKHHEICPEARVFSVADTYEAITRDRCYRQGAPYAVAAKEILDGAGSQFDPEVVEAFFKVGPEEWEACVRDT
jgi:putative nucleotidyltransferase with HDIG domain